MKEFLYDINAALIAGVLFVAMVGAIEIGFRLGFRSKDSSDEASREHIKSIQSSILGILGLVLAFTFSLSLERFDRRSDAVVDEANAIGTAYLRTQLLPPSMRNDTQTLLRQYLDLRIQASSLSTVQDDQVDSLVARSTAAQTALWNHAQRAAELAPNPVTSGLFIQALNDLIDSFGKRDAAVNRHVPEVVLLLLFGTLLIAGASVGLSCGVCGRRPSLVSFGMVAVIVALIFVIVDLDRPRRGLIEVSQKSLLDLRAAVNEEARAVNSPAPAASASASGGGRR